MRFVNHRDLEGKHAFLGASKSTWLRYDDDKVVQTYRNARAAAIGTKLHEIAAEHIRMGLPFGETTDTVGMFVNDAIRYDMTPEQVLYFSPYAFGTADAISFDPDAELLRIHDLKTGLGPTKFEQLEIYAALFCLEYNVAPTISMHLRIYQNGEVRPHNPDPDDIREIMRRIVHFSNVLNTEDQC